MFLSISSRSRSPRLHVVVIGGIGNLRASDFCLTMEIRADISAAPSANFAPEPWLEIGEPDVIRPVVRRTQRCVVTAGIIRSVDQQAVNASGAHCSKADLRRASSFAHAALKCGRAGNSPEGYLLPGEHMQRAAGPENCVRYQLSS
jgi:hypothetical protein